MERRERILAMEWIDANEVAIKVMDADIESCLTRWNRFGITRVAAYIELSNFVLPELEAIKAAMTNEERELLERLIPQIVKIADENKEMERNKLKELAALLNHGMR